MSANLELSLDEIAASRPKREKKPSGGGQGGGAFDGVCNKCGKTGHKGKDCRSGKGGGKGARKGGRESSNRGNERREQPYTRDSRGMDDNKWVRSNIACNICGEVGHSSDQCPQLNRRNNRGGRDDGDGNKRTLVGGFDGECHVCGEVGHRARDCPQGNAGGNAGGARGFDGECRVCGEVGHRARDCPQGNAGGGERRNSQSRGNNQSRGGGGGKGKGNRGGGDKKRSGPVSASALDAEMDSYFNRATEPVASNNQAAAPAKNKGGNTKAAPVSAADLDAEMDSYFNKKE
jgi:hypothetical protein